MNPIGGEIWFQMTLLLGIAVASHFVVTRFGQPAVIFEIVLGIVIGPSIFALITNSNNLIYQFAQLGAIFLLFSIGLECNLNEIYTRKSLVIATCGVVVPWIVGFLFGITIGQPFGVSVFIGAILVATSVAVTAGILIDMGQLNTKVGKTIIGAAVVDDVLGMIVLTLVLGLSGKSISLSSPGDLLPVFTLVVAAGLFIIIGGFIGSRYLGKIVMYIEAKTTKVQHSGFLFALAIMFLYAFVSTWIGLTAIIGAFVAGTMFSSVQVKKEFDDGARFLASVFAPIFFISIGILVDFRGLISLHVVMLGIILTSIAIFTKVIGCSIPAKAMGMSTKESLIVGYGMSPRCEVALMIALIGLAPQSIGLDISPIIDQNIYFMAVLMAILTTLVTPPFLKMLLKKEKKTKSKAELIDALNRKKRI